MKVVVGKMPGGRATEVEIPEGGTVLDAIKAAGYESDLNNGFEARLNNSQTELSSTVSANEQKTQTDDSQKTKYTRKVCSKEVLMM